VAAADVNRDGKIDLLVANRSGTVGVLLNNTTLGKAGTSTSLISSLNPSIYGQKVTWTATVTSSGSVTPTGTVKFTWSGHTIGSATLNSTGVATLTKSNLNADTYPLTAVYAGDASNLGSTSAVLSQVVLEATSTATLTSSPNPSAQGQAVTFTATITSPTVKPTGPVTFTTGKTVLGTAQLSGGKAKLTISSLAARAKPRSRPRTTETPTSLRVQLRLSNSAVEHGVPQTVLSGPGSGAVQTAPLPWAQRNLCTSSPVDVTRP
jgi:hypothetical protein